MINFGWPPDLEENKQIMNMWFFYQYLICCAWKMRRRDTKAWQEGTGGDVKKLTEHSMTTWNRTRWWWTSNEHLMEGEILMMMAGMTMVEWERVLRKRMSTKIRIGSTICIVSDFLPPTDHLPESTKGRLSLKQDKNMKVRFHGEKREYVGDTFSRGSTCWNTTRRLLCHLEGGGALDNREHCAAAL